MSDRERWIVYPLLLMSLGLALQPKILQVGKSNFDEVKCQRLECDDIVVKRALVKVELDAQRAKTGLLSADTVTAKRATIDTIGSRQVGAHEVVVADALGVRQAAIVSTEHGGRIDVERYALRGSVPFRNGPYETFVSDKRGVPIQLGIAHVHLAAGEESKGDSTSKSNASDATKGAAPGKTEDAATKEADRQETP